MADDEESVGYKRPPVHSRFQKGQSGNPQGRPKRVPDFLEDAAAILSAPVTGRVNGKQVTLPAPQAMFRSQCRKALKGDNAALRRVIDLMLTLEPEAKQKAEQAVDMKKAVEDLHTELLRQKAILYGPNAIRVPE